MSEVLSIVLSYGCNCMDTFGRLNSIRNTSLREIKVGNNPHSSSSYCQVTKSSATYFTRGNINKAIYKKIAATFLIDF
jgi:hypothetical protein